MKTNCDNCGAATSTIYSACPFCKTPIRSSRTLTAVQEEELEKFVRSIEERIKSHQNDKDRMVFGGCLMILVLISGSWIWIYSQDFGTTFMMLLGGFVALTLFTAWGFIVDAKERQSYKAAYQDQIKGDIQHFLETRNYYRYEFDLLASEKLAKGAILKRFLFKKG